MKEITIYNSNYEFPVSIINNGERITLNPKESMLIEVDGWLGSENFKLEESQDRHWVEAYHGRYNENIIFRLAN